MYDFLADAVMVGHLLFVVFVVAGGFLLFRWPKLVWLHGPSFVWGGAASLFGWTCPLTPLENYLRRLADGEGAGYESGYIEHYLFPLLYPEHLFEGGFPRQGFIALGVIVLAINGVIYWRVWRGRGSGD